MSQLNVEPIVIKMEPCAVILSSSIKILPEKIIEDILGTELPEPIIISKNIKGYPWNIKTKYYDAQIHLCAMNEKKFPNQEFIDSIQAIVLCIDSMGSLSDLEDYRQLDCEVKLIVCDRVNTDAEGDKIRDWCVANEFALVELNPDITSDGEDEFPETFGIKQIIEALETNLWPNMIRKGSGELDGLKSDITGAASVSGTNENSEITKEMVDSMKRVEEFFEQMDLFGTEKPSFDLLEKERKDYAEKVTMAFWRAFGGNDSEIDSDEAE